MLSWLKSSKFRGINIPLGFSSPNRVDLTPGKDKICAAADAGIELLLSRERNQKRGQYGKCSGREQVTIAKYAVVNESTVKGIMSKSTNSDF